MEDKRKTYKHPSYGQISLGRTHGGSRYLYMMEKVLQEMRSNIPFVYDMFNEAMDKTILEAKGEVEAFVEHKLRSIGVDHAGADMIVDKRDPDAKLEIDVKEDEPDE